MPLLTLDTVVSIAAGAYIRCAVPPSVDELRSLYHTWREDAGDPMTSTLKARPQSPEIRVVSADDIMCAPDHLLLCMGCTPDELACLKRATHVCMLLSTGKRAELPGSVAATLGAAYAIAKKFDGVIFDPAIPRLIGQRPQLSQHFRASHHIIAPFSVDENGEGWLTTKGMGRYGLPELEMTQVPGPYAEPLHMLLNALAHYVYTEASTAGDELNLPDEFVFAPPELSGRSAPLGWEYKPPDHVEASAFLKVVPPRSFVGSLQDWYAVFIEQCFGPQDRPPVQLDPEMLKAAHARAVAELHLVEHQFNSGLSAGQSLLVKIPFPVEGRGLEYMWVQVSRWKGNAIRGNLASFPEYRTDLKVWQVLDLDRDQIFDWMIQSPDGSFVGGYTEAIATEWK